jgi:hypothetical protein
LGYTLTLSQIWSHTDFIPREKIRGLFSFKISFFLQNLLEAFWRPPSPVLADHSGKKKTKGFLFSNPEVKVKLERLVEYLKKNIQSSSVFTVGKTSDHG